MKVLDTFADLCAAYTTFGCASSTVAGELLRAAECIIAEYAANGTSPYSAYAPECVKRSFAFIMDTAPRLRAFHRVWVHNTECMMDDIQRAIAQSVINGEFNEANTINSRNYAR